MAGLPVYPVSYAVPGAKRQTPTREDLVTKKRLMFEYEREVRVVQFLDGDPPNPEIRGCRLDWDPAIHVESIRVHPNADPSFLDTVTPTVKQYAPSLTAQVAWSEMRTPPPF
jgi:hypothetical protein